MASLRLLMTDAPVFMTPIFGQEVSRTGVKPAFNGPMQAGRCKGLSPGHDRPGRSRHGLGRIQEHLSGRADKSSPRSLPAGRRYANKRFQINNNFPMARLMPGSGHPSGIHVKEAGNEANNGHKTQGGMPMSYSIAVFLVPALLALAYPYVRRTRHPRERALAAYLLFVTLFSAMGALSFLVLIWAITWLGSERLLNEPFGVVTLLFLVLIPSFLVARWRILRPPWKRPLPKQATPAGRSARARYVEPSPLAPVICNTKEVRHERH
jgi:hypothetical protein